MHEPFIIRLKQRLTQPLPGRTAQLLMAPSFRPDLASLASTIKAGVLILLYPDPEKLSLVLMKRNTYPGIHSAQISFPGGKSDPVDKNLIETALREANEETGVDIDTVEVVGTLTPLYIPVSGFEVYPTVAFVPGKPTFIPDATEVDYLIEEPIENLLQPGIIRTKPYRSDKYTGTIPYYDIQGEEVWGATAMILSEFIEVLK